MIKENPLFHGARAHFSILTQMNSGLRKAVGLAAGIETVHISFIFAGARLGVLNGREHEEKRGGDEEDQRENGDVGDPIDVPLRAPTRERPVQPPTKYREKRHDYHEDEKRVFINMIQNVVAHLVAHYGLNFFR